MHCTLNGLLSNMIAKNCCCYNGRCVTEWMIVHLCVDFGRCTYVNKTKITVNEKGKRNIRYKRNDSEMLSFHLSAFDANKLNVKSFRKSSLMVLDDFRIDNSWEIHAKFVRSSNILNFIQINRFSSRFYLIQPILLCYLKREKKSWITDKTFFIKNKESKRIQYSDIRCTYTLWYQNLNTLFNRTEHFNQSANRYLIQLNQFNKHFHV